MTWTQKRESDWKFVVNIIDVHVSMRGSRQAAITGVSFQTDFCPRVLLVSADKCPSNAAIRRRFSRSLRARALIDNPFDLLVSCGVWVDSFYALKLITCLSSPHIFVSHSPCFPVFQKHWDNGKYKELLVFSSIRITPSFEWRWRLCPDCNPQ